MQSSWCRRTYYWWHLSCSDNPTLLDIKYESKRDKKGAVIVLEKPFLSASVQILFQTIFDKTFATKIFLNTMPDTMIQWSSNIAIKSICCFTFTRSCAALRAADLDWIVGPEYSLGGYIFGDSQLLRRRSLWWFKVDWGNSWRRTPSCRTTAFQLFFVF